MEGIKLDEEAQVAELEEQLANWKRKRAIAAMNDDDQGFDELHARVLATEKELKDANTRLEKTTTDYDFEEAAKAKRDLDAEIAAAKADFE